MIKYLPLFLLLLGIACKSKQSIPKAQTLQLSNDKQVLFYDSLLASQAIIVDEVEHFFDYITKTDVSIQIKESFPPSLSREEAVSRYRDFLKKDVMSFSPADVTFIEKVFRDIDVHVKPLAKDILTPQIKLIKTHGRHYGPSVYYTRENCIVIPKDVLATPNYEAFYNTMLHEIFHIYSRYNPEKRTELYELIGFKSIGDPTLLKMNAPLRDRVLLNPDGVNYAVAIELKLNDGEKVRAIPIIYSQKDGYVEKQDAFFSYLGFNLFPIQPPLSRLIQVQSDQKGQSKLNIATLADFRRQIRDNTDYIIHPDEILADNFMYLINSMQDESYLQKFSEEGQQLIQSVKAIMQK